MSCPCSATVPRRRRLQAEHGLADRRLARAGLADHAEGLVPGAMSKLTPSTAGGRAGPCGPSRSGRRGRGPRGRAGATAAAAVAPAGAAVMTALQRSGRALSGCASARTLGADASASQVASAGEFLDPDAAHRCGRRARAAAANGTGALRPAANWQRAANRQPVGHEPGGGTVPGDRRQPQRHRLAVGHVRVRPEQRHRVRVRGVVQHGRGGAGLDDLAGVHDRDVVADVGDHAQVVADDAPPTARCRGPAPAAG